MTQNIEVEISELRQITSWLAAVDIEFVEISKPGVTIRLTMQQEPCAASRAMPEPASRAHSAGAVDVPDAAHRPGITVAAASVGVFLAAHPARSAPLAAVGDHVKQGDIVGLLQIAQLCVPVLAPVDGVVTEMRVAHGATVGYGTALLELAPST
jgi:acetyl-CoA carboxylase biotin carboxyl carrier protein